MRVPTELMDGFVGFFVETTGAAVPVGAAWCDAIVAHLEANALILKR
jgi:hypothetical protein